MVLMLLGRHAHKLENLKYRHRFGVSVVQNNPNVVVNLSTYKLSDAEIMLLSRGLNFSVPLTDWTILLM